MTLCLIIMNNTGMITSIKTWKQRNPIPWIIARFHAIPQCCQGINVTDYNFNLDAWL